MEKEAHEPPPNEEDLDMMLEAEADKDLKRDDWMEAPSSLSIEYVSSRRFETPKSRYQQSTAADYALKVHEKELNPQLALRKISTEDSDQEMVEKPAQHEVKYTFGDAGSSWRMMKLKAVYRQAEETGASIEDIAIERYGDLREFDDACEEEIEIDRRKMYGDGSIGKTKPSGELFEERKLARGFRRSRSPDSVAPRPQQGEVMNEAPPPATTVPLDQNVLNKLKAQVMRTKLKGGPEAARLEAEYNAAAARMANGGPNVVILDTMENRRLAGGRHGEVKAVETKRGRERGLVVENQDMTIEDMIRQERKTKGRNEGLALAERIGRDDRFKDNLDYLDDNAEKLAKSKAKTDLDLRNISIEDYQRMQRVLESCPLCHHEDKPDPLPTAPMISLGTRTYLTLPTEPELAAQSACIVPLEHHTNLLECDDDEWEELRNFMKCLTRMYHAQGRGVLFYENAAAPDRRLHAALMAVPLPPAVAETAPAYFREAFMSSDEEWSQHKKVIDTLKAAKEKGLGRNAFRRGLVKEAPYFHVWFELDGGLGHIVENERRWPKGDLFAREVLGGMLNVEPQVFKRQGRWTRQDRRKEGFRAVWDKFDWTKVLLQGQ